MGVHEIPDRGRPSGLLNIKERLRYMDESGIWGADHLSQLPRFRRAAGLTTGRRYPSDHVPDLQRCDGRDSAGIGQPHLPDGDDAVVEHRGVGGRGDSLPEDGAARRQHEQPSAKPRTPRPGPTHWDRLWEVCNDLNLPINFHIGASDESSSWFTSIPWASQTADQKLALGSAMLFVNNAGCSPT